MKLLSTKDYPKTIKITPEVEYTIKFVKAIPCGEDETVWGDCDSEAKVIRILRKQAPVDMFKTFLHEVTHAIEEEYKIKISHRAVHKFETAVFNVLFMNF